MHFLLAVLIVSAATIAAAQEKSGEQGACPSPAASAAPSPEARRGVRPGDVQKVFIVNHVAINDLVRVLHVFPAELSGMERDNRRVLSVSAAPAVVAAIEETIKRLDVPPPPIKSVEITAYVLECTTSGEAGTLSPDLQGVLVQLKKTSTIRVRRGAHAARPRVGWQPLRRGVQRAHAGVYELTGRVEVDSSEPPHGAPARHGPRDLVRLDAKPAERRHRGARGQKVVLGRLGVTESGKDQIVVLTAKVAP
jgi:hypothetical protein